MQKIQEIAGVAVHIGAVIEIQERKTGSNTGNRTRILALRGGRNSGKGNSPAHSESDQQRAEKTVFGPKEKD
jgi:hypothetical protein